VHRRRLAVSISLLVLACLLGAVAALAVRSLAFGDDGRTLAQAPPPPPAPTSLDRLLLKSDDARTLNDVAFALIGARDFDRALPFSRKAVRKATPGTLTYGFANFNLGFTLLKLGRCAESLSPLQTALHAEPRQYRRFIKPRIKQAKRCDQRAAAEQAPSR
jgi:tetratricopeptide (TPR) repeat protein